MGLSEAEYQQLLANQRAANPAVEKAAWGPRGGKSEAELERVCTQILMHDGWRALKTNPVSRRGRGAGFGELGMADYLYIRYFSAARGMAEVLWVEWKREGGVVAEHQLRWHAEERARGALVVVAGQDFEASVDGFWEFYKRSGLLRGGR